MTNAIIPTSRAQAKALGAKRYLTGKPCPHGHVAERFTCDAACVECRTIRAATPKQREYLRAYHREYGAAYYAANVDRKREKAKRYRAENPEKVRAALQRWREENAERVREYSAEYYAKNQERLREKERNNRDAARIRKNTRKARKLAAPGVHTVEDVAEIMRLQRGRCAYCPKRLGKRYHVDHVIALAKGGTNDRRNLQITCPTCNRRKHSKDPISFARELGKLL